MKLLINLFGNIRFNLILAIRYFPFNLLLKQHDLSTGELIEKTIWQKSLPFHT